MQALSQLSYTPKTERRIIAFSGGCRKPGGTPKRHQAAVKLAEWTGLEPATPGVTGRYSNQLNYHSALTFTGIVPALRPSIKLRRAVLASPRGFEPRLSP